MSANMITSICTVTVLRKLHNSNWSKVSQKLLLVPYRSASLIIVLPVNSFMIIKVLQWILHLSVNWLLPLYIYQSLLDVLIIVSINVQYLVAVNSDNNISCAVSGHS